MYFGGLFNAFLKAGREVSLRPVYTRNSLDCLPPFKYRLIGKLKNWHRRQNVKYVLRYLNILQSYIGYKIYYAIHKHILLFNYYLDTKKLGNLL